MIASELLSEVVPAIHKNDKAAEALNWMDVFKISHLPIVDNDEYIGLISEIDIFDMNNPEIPVLDHKLSLERPFVKDYQHIFEVVELASKLKLTAIPVLGENEKYLGLITITDLAMEFAHLMNCESPGGIIVLKVKVNDYSLSEISQIVESNDAKILSMYVRTSNPTKGVEINIKVNKTDIVSIIKTFERYSYKIISTYSENNELDSILKDRLDSFLKYLNI
jgi:CBS domain-containing protein